MFNPLKKLFRRKFPHREAKFDRSVLRKNNIHLLILDERWNGLFKNIPKTAEIIECEKKLKELLKEESRLTAEAKVISRRKKLCMDRILKLTTDVFDKNDEKAKVRMHKCENEIKYINKRMKEVEEGLEIIPDKIRDVNLELLEHTVNTVYFKMRENQRRNEELEKLTEVTKQKLMEYTEEKAILSEDNASTYSYFHDLIGGEELEKLDREYFGENIPGKKEK